ncbi:MAG: signal recognition particle protein [Kiloniellales bacterium]
MFDSLSTRLAGIFERLKKRGALSESEVASSLREIRVALLEADVALPVVKDFIAKVRQRAVGQEVLRSVTPGQMVVKLVHDHLVELLGAEARSLNLAAEPPAAILLVGLQGSGKTTTAAKLGLRLATRERKKVLMTSLDVRRPAAQEQLARLGHQAGVPTLPMVSGETPEEMARRALEAGRLEGYDVVLLDTAGRLHVDQALMREITRVRDTARPVETLLVADAMTGQDAVNIARSFDQAVGLTGIILTRVDGDARGGAALSMRAVTGCPIKLLGVGEKLDALDAFHPDRIAGRILGMGDVVGLVEKAAETVEAEAAERLARKVQKGEFDLDDLLAQLRQMRQMGGPGGLIAMLPGVAETQRRMAEAQIDDTMIKRQEAIILSMTPVERRRAKILNGSRRRRIASGSGTTVPEVNRLLKQHQQMQKVLKKMGKPGDKRLARLPGLPVGGFPGGFSGGFPR